MKTSSLPPAAPRSPLSLVIGGIVVPRGGLALYAEHGAQRQNGLRATLLLRDGVKEGRDQQERAEEAHGVESHEDPEVPGVAELGPEGEHCAPNQNVEPRPRDSLEPGALAEVLQNLQNAQEAGCP